MKVWTLLPLVHGRYVGEELPSLELYDEEITNGDEFFEAGIFVETVLWFWIKLSSEKDCIIRLLKM